MKSALPSVLRIIAILLVIGGVALGIMDAYGMARLPVSTGESLGSRLPAVAQAVAIVLGLVGLGVLLFAVAEIMQPASGATSNAENDLKPALAEVNQSLHRLEASIRDLADHQRDVVHHAPPHFADVAGADTVAGAGASHAESLQQVITLLQQIHEMAFLTDEQRQARLADTRVQRRNQLAGEVQRLLDARDWQAAENALAILENEFDDVPDLAKLKSQLATGKQSAEQSAIQQLRDRVEDLMAVWAWDQAYAETVRFVESFPDHAEGRELLQRVMTEREKYIETTANRLYEEIRLDVDRRLYRRAMANAVKLLECAPGHRKSVAIRGQLKTIRENAEIEERQEQERRIQELIRNKQFLEAIDLSEDLLARFPNSPQAETLQKLLPKMRELAIGAEAQV